MIRMELRILLGVCIFQIFGVIMAKPDLMQMQFNSSKEQTRKCSITCKDIEYSPVCGSDGKVYRNSCELDKAITCKGKKIQLENQGLCRAGRTDLKRKRRRLRSSFLSKRSKVHKCIDVLEEKKNVLEMFSKDGLPVVDGYVPQCTDDGNFAQVQCHDTAGYCWCVKSDGSPIPGTSIPKSFLDGKKISCKESRGKLRRGRLKIKDECTLNNRLIFNDNLIALFSEEFDRVEKPINILYNGISVNLDEELSLKKKTIIWKFFELDTNKNGKIEKKEIHSLHRMVKKYVSPKSCSRTFDVFSDKNSDDDIDMDEWTSSLIFNVSDIEDKRKLILKLPNIKAQEKKSKDIVNSLKTDDVPDSLKKKENFKTKRSNKRKPKHKTSQKSIETKRNCLEERKIAQEQDSIDPQGGIFIPECDVSGLFQVSQCHKSTGYCWCVDRLTGKPLLGSTTHNEKPNCANIRSREYKGCPYARKKKFLVEILDHLTMEMMSFTTTNQSNSVQPEPHPDHSLEEQVVRWKLKVLDLNKNEVLERKEWKKFKAQIEKKNVLRKCARNFLNFCDSDDDKKITMNEWIDCFDINESKKQILPNNEKRRGPNPFSKYLRSS